MHRWAFQRFVRWLLPTLAYGIGLCGIVLELKHQTHGLAFGEDSAYRNLAVARTLAETFRYGLRPDRLVIARENVLWRFLLAATGRLVGRYEAASYALGALIGAAIVFLILQLAQKLFPFPPFVVFTTLLAIANGSLLVEAIGGTGAVLGMLLFCWALERYVRGCMPGRLFLDRYVVTALCLAVLIRVEFVIVWVLLVTHALLLSLIKRRRDGAVTYVSLRFWTGLLVFGIALAPLIAWNLWIVRVPWPQVPSAPMTVDYGLRQSPETMWEAYKVAAREGMALAWAQMQQLPWLQPSLLGWFCWIGLGFLAVVGCVRREERPFTILPWTVLCLPVCAGIIYPFVGSSGIAVVVKAISPVLVLPITFLVFRSPLFVEEIYRKFKPGLPAIPGVQWWWSILGVVVFAVSIVKVRHEIAAYVDRTRTYNECWDQIATQLDARYGPEVRVVSDHVGWLAWRTRWLLWDLTGEATPGILAALRMDGKYQGDKLISYLQDQGVAYWIAWGEIPKDVESGLLALDDVMPSDLFGGTAPKVFEVKPRGVF